MSEAEYATLCEIYDFTHKNANKHLDLFGKQCDKLSSLYWVLSGQEKPPRILYTKYK